MHSKHMSNISFLITSPLSSPLSSRYRSSTEIQDWHDNNDPIKRFRAYMEDKGERLVVCFDSI